MVKMPAQAGAVAQVAERPPIDGWTRGRDAGSSPVGVTQNEGRWILVHHSIGAVLRRVRLKRGMSLKTVARRAGTTFGYLSQVERGDKSPSSEMIWNICAAMKVPMSTVLLEASILLADKERREKQYERAA